MQPTQKAVWLLSKVNQDISYDHADISLKNTNDV
jgi:hypothetical protein